VDGSFQVHEGWESISGELKHRLSLIQAKKKIVAVEYYQGVLETETTTPLIDGINPDAIIYARECMWEPEKIAEIVHPYVTDDRIFGYIAPLEIESFFDPARVENARRKIASLGSGIVLVVGTGASIVAEECHLLVYADMARWEIQLRMREHLVDNVGLNNRRTEDWTLLYKQGYFVDWRVCDRLKKKTMKKWSYLLDTNNRTRPKMAAADAINEGLSQTLTRPFSVVPFFDPAPWGGQWMKRHFGLDPRIPNYGWCFNCVPEENSLFLNFSGKVIEIPALDLVLYDSASLLGANVLAQFGEEFPIRFDYLDTFEGSNLSLQVHPTTEYIQNNFGVRYTQDESYYIMDAKPGSVVYLGLKEGSDSSRMISELETAQRCGAKFDPVPYVQTWPVKKHDHFLIPAGTIHCSGKDSLVLEISATPYLFTFKLWDWGRLGLDDRPRPINIEHGKHVIQWERTTAWTKDNLINRTETVGHGDGWREERTGLHEAEFIETRRHWFSAPVRHDTGGTVNVLNLVHGDEVVIESPSGKFNPFAVHYAETFIVPAAVGEYVIRPIGKSEGKECATIKAYVRTSV